MRQYLSTKYDSVISSKDYIVAVGDIPVALTAHLDTVFKTPPEDIYYDRVKNVMWSPDGLGADDRAGVYAITNIVKSGLRPTIVLTTDEELGCLGASKLVQSMPNAPTDLKYIIELDRRGSDDCVFYSCNNPEFDEYVESFGFVTNFGSFSDISTICPAWGMAGVNLSIGYYNEHSVSETLHIGNMFNTIAKVKKMLEAADSAPIFKYIEEKGFSSKWFKSLGAQSNVVWDWDPAYGISKEDWVRFMEPQTKCIKCKNWDYDYNMIPVKDESGATVFFCSDCLTQTPNVHWCSICGEPFIDKELPEDEDAVCYCKDCRGKLNESKQN